jgi:hypothetical protein
MIKTRSELMQRAALASIPFALAGAAVFGLVIGMVFGYSLVIASFTAPMPLESSITLLVMTAFFAASWWPVKFALAGFHDVLFAIFFHVEAEDEE